MLLKHQKTVGTMIVVGPCNVVLHAAALLLPYHSHQLGYMVPSGGCGSFLFVGEAICRLSSINTVSMV